MTVAWMLACMSTTVGMLVVFALRLLMVLAPVAAGVHPLARIAGVLLFVALVTGGLAVAFTPLAYKVRQVAPPRAITIVAVVIGLLPLATLLALLVLENK